MASFYGNIKNNSRASFIFDRIYSSRVDMEIALKENIDSNKATQGDGVFINRYVLIDYGYSDEGSYVIVDQTKVNENNVKNFYLAINTGLGYYTYEHPKDPIDYTQTYYQKVNFVDRFTYGQLENTYYRENRQKDQDAYFADYDLTVWMKIYSDNEEKYIMVARLSVDPPSMELIIDAPADKNGGAHFDLLQSSDKNYVYHVPNTWYVKLNEYNPNNQSTYTLNNDVDGYWEYEYDIENVNNRTYNPNHEYPFYNQAGFNPYIKSISDAENEFTFNDTKSGRRYLNHRYQIIDLTPETYRRNQYYIEQNGEYLIAVGEFNKNETYYIKTQAITDDFQPITLTENTYRRNYYYIPIFEVDENNDQTEEISGYVISSAPYDETQTYYTNIAESEQLDTKRLDISLPSIGNSVSDMYDSIYGQPNAASNYLIGYTDTITANGYATNSTGEHSISVRIVNPNTGEIKYLTQGEIDLLYHDDTTPHSIPVYDTTGKRRPYTAGQLYRATDIDPYNNIYPNDPISMGWGIYEIKKYLSELKLLSHGDGVIGYTKETLITQYDQDDEGLYNILENRYNLTEEQVAALQPYSDEYNIPVKKGIGLQSDWTLDNTSAFGYIYHKPRVLWSNSTNNNATTADTNYLTAHTIEYIYDHYTEANSTLFGPNRDQASWLNARY